MSEVSRDKSRPAVGLVAVGRGVGCLYYMRTSFRRAKSISSIMTSVGSGGAIIEVLLEYWCIQSLI